MFPHLFHKHSGGEIIHKGSLVLPKKNTKEKKVYEGTIRKCEKCGEPYYEEFEREK